MARSEGFLSLLFLCLFWFGYLGSRGVGLVWIFLPLLPVSFNAPYLPHEKDGVLRVDVAGNNLTPANTPLFGEKKIPASIPPFALVFFFPSFSSTLPCLLVITG